jgi:hypothetical protein
MPMTDEQTKWLAMKEHERQVNYKEYLHDLTKKEKDTKVSNTASSKSTTKGTNGKNSTSSSKKEIKSTTTRRDIPPIPPPPPVLEDPEEIMQNKFPIFDSFDYPEAQGALRCQQLEECNRVYEALSKKFPHVDMNVIERALVTPQDRNVVRDFLPSPSLHPSLLYHWSSH